MTGAANIVVGLNAVIVAAGETASQVLVVRRPDGSPALPFGPFDPAGHRTFETGLRDWVREQAHFQLGYVEQLYTFGDEGRDAPVAELAGAAGARVISVGYLGLAPQAAPTPEGGGVWTDWGRFFPWEDWRTGRPALIGEALEPALRAWADEGGSAGERTARTARLRAAFGTDGADWNEERALERYELLYSAGLIVEAQRDRGLARHAVTGLTGEAMASDHRRILATAIGRLRGKIKYRPVVFEMMPERFTLSQLQRVIEAIVGFPLHKQNFRRALDRTGFVEGTGRMETGTGGRPAELFRFRREALGEGPATGIATPRLR